jgi:hypothetical protein
MKDINKCRLKRKKGKEWGSERTRNKHTGNNTAR